MPEIVDNGLPSRAVSLETDRFGYPVRWSIEFRRTALRFFDFQSHVNPEYVRLCTELRNRIDIHTEQSLGALTPSDPARTSALSSALTSVVVVVSFPIRIGGMRLLLEVARMIKLSGVEVHIVLRRGASLSGENVSLFDSVIAVADDGGLQRYLDSKHWSFILLGSWVDCAETAMAVDLSDCSVTIFTAGEPTLNSDSLLDGRFVHYRNAVLQLPVRILVFSRFMQELIRRVHLRPSYYVPAPLDGVFYSVRALERSSVFRIGLNASLSNPRKGVSCALRSVVLLRMRSVPVAVTWISQDRPKVTLPDYFTLRVDVTPRDVAASLARCDVLLFPSVVEGLGLPPLEAMALGVPVVLTMNGGAAEYAIGNWNCLVVPGNDVCALADAAERIRTDASLRNYLVQNGLRTAARFSWSESRARLSAALACLSAAV